MTTEVKEVRTLLISDTINGKPFTVELELDAKKNRTVSIPYLSDIPNAFIDFEVFKQYLNFLNTVEKNWTKILKKNKEIV